ncbi:reverse transcriptase domain-containing protein [Carnobacterium maltaromaticum]|uniref:reverse transcriptase domain-containing protein n=1 Tax=Carnobacterium maltaromaticum TaxID=2751 RepID=UPI00295E9999|nr:reverse transcriptase domain-containing protein [Carnobacterium maltaromaticum]
MEHFSENYLAMQCPLANEKNEELLTLSYNYVLEVAKSKPFNIQCIAIKNFFKNSENEPLKDQSYHSNYQVFCDKHPINYARDFIYKKDYYTTREMYLIAPSHYLYYTYNVFKYFYKTFGRIKLDFSTKNLKINYSGIISFTKEESIRELSKFNHSYELFQDKKNEFIGNKVLTIDIQDFFKSISSKKLIDKLRRRNPSKICENDINNLEQFFNANYFTHLPQFHYSIASSSLSQFYLIDFSNEVDRILSKENCEGVRFVDDIFIKLPKGKWTKTINNMLNEFTYYLWCEGLNLNTSKTKIFDRNEYEKNVQLEEGSYFDEQVRRQNNKSKSRFPTEKLIADKVDTLLINDAELLETFLMKLKKLDNTKGIDLTEYHKLVDQYIAIDGEHVSKVINNLMYGYKWTALSPSTLNKLISSNRFIFFNPSQFTTFFILIYERLKLLKSLEDDFLSILINLLKHQNSYTLRECIITIQHFVQIKSLDPELEKKIIDVNAEFINFIREYIIK